MMSQNFLYSPVTRPDGPWLLFVFTGVHLVQSHYFFANRRMKRQITVFQIFYSVSWIRFLIEWVIFEK